jgi:leucyl aminopeptidase
MPKKRPQDSLKAQPDGVTPGSPAIPVHLVDEAGWETHRLALPAPVRAYADATGFTPKAGRILMAPGMDGAIDSVLLGTGGDPTLADQPFLLGKLATELPKGRYAIAGTLADPTLAYLGFLSGQYRFDRFKTITREAVELDPPAGADAVSAARIAAAMANGRDLINRPANDLTTVALAEAALALAARFKAKSEVIVGDELLKENFPLVHAVGRAGPNPPRLVSFVWGKAKHPKVTLVGKGVVFDTGGLDIKPDTAMLLMKKDMGGAAAALAAAEMIMAEGLPVRLRVILPIVENSVSAPAFRPGDVYRSRKGKTVEIGNTDAEGRLILADALALADGEKPDLLIDYATLTGAARVALGPDLPPFFTTSEPLAAEISEAGKRAFDPVWRLPLWKPYQSMLDSKVADMNNVSSGGFAGSITAALFLRAFVTDTEHYAHFDIYGWNPTAKPGRPEGGEPQAARLTLELVRGRYVKLN